jgi:hypothetical protein
VAVAGTAKNEPKVQADLKLRTLNWDYTVFCCIGVLLVISRKVSFGVGYKFVSGESKIFSLCFAGSVAFSYQLGQLLSRDADDCWTCSLCVELFHRQE